MTDIFRDTWIRYLGYANEVGESFRPLVDPKYVRYSYGVAFGYVVADTVDKSFAKLRKDGRPHKVLFAAGDALIWQSLASVIIPGYAINRINYGTRYLLANYAKNVPVKNRNWIAVIVSLACIPIIITPIDRATDVFMNLTYRQIFGK